MHYRTLGIVSLALSAASVAFIRGDEGTFYAVVFFVVGLYGFYRSEIRKEDK